LGTGIDGDRLSLHVEAFMPQFQGKMSTSNLALRSPIASAVSGFLVNLFSGFLEIFLIWRGGGGFSIELSKLYSSLQLENFVVSELCCRASTILGHIRVIVLHLPFLVQLGVERQPSHEKARQEAETGEANVHFPQFGQTLGKCYSNLIFQWLREALDLRDHSVSDFDPFGK
jgi:hypothetical protein